MRRLYWVCGEEEVFRLQVVKRIRELAGAKPLNTLRLNAAEISETEIWAYLNQHPLDSEQKRLLVVHEAQRLHHLDRLVVWIKANQTTRSRNAVAIFVSIDPDLTAEQREDITKSSSAMLVRCTLPRNADDRLKRAVEIVTRWGNIDPTTAGVLVKRVNFDMREAWAFMEKVNRLPAAHERKVGVPLVEALAPRRSEEDVVWSLIALNKRKAVEAVTEDTWASAGRIIGSLATAVDTLSRMNGLMTTTRSVKDMAHKVGAREQYVRTLMPYARLYPRSEAVRRTLLLNRLDHAYHRGADQGVLESLIALW